MYCIVTLFYFNQWRIMHKTALWHKQSCCFAPENILRAISRTLCASSECDLLCYCFSLLFLLWGWRWGGNGFDHRLEFTRQAALFALTQNEQTNSFKCFFEVNKILSPGQGEWQQDWLLFRVSPSTQTRSAPAQHFLNAISVMWIW